MKLRPSIDVKCDDLPPIFLRSFVTITNSAGVNFRLK